MIVHYYELRFCDDSSVELERVESGRLSTGMPPFVVGQRMMRATPAGEPVVWCVSQIEYSLYDFACVTAPDPELCMVVHFRRVE